MDENDKRKIQQIIHNREKAHQYYRKRSEVYRSFLLLEKSTFSSGELEKKHKELIAIGISIVKNCESCLEWHIHEALKTHASIQEIIEAIGVGIEMGGGPATVSSRFAMNVIEYYCDTISFQEITTGDLVFESVAIIQKAFLPIAHEFKLTIENCPTNPAFITLEQLLEVKKNGDRFFGTFFFEKLVGFVALESGDQNVLFLKRLAVLPAYQHHGLGKFIVDNCIQIGKQTKMLKISVGIINENQILKKWYKSQDFMEISLKQFPHLPFTVCYLEKQIS